MSLTERTSTAERLRGLAPNLDNVQPFSKVTSNEDINAKLAERADRPTATLDRMIDNAKDMVATLKLQRETLESMREVQQKDAEAHYARAQSEDTESIKRMETILAETRRGMTERTEAHRKHVKRINDAIDEQVGAVDKMLAAQRSVIDAGLGTKDSDLPF